MILSNVLKMNASQKSAMLCLFIYFLWNAPNELHNYLSNLNSSFTGILLQEWIQSILCNCLPLVTSHDQHIRIMLLKLLMVKIGTFIFIICSSTLDKWFEKSTNELILKPKRDQTTHFWVLCILVYWLAWSMSSRYLSSAHK